MFMVSDADIFYYDPLIIEDYVWIGPNAWILPGCKFIGRGAVIGAGAVVTRNVERYPIGAGNPARKLRARFSPELIEAIEASKWWELNLDRKSVVEEKRWLVRVDLGGRRVIKKKRYMLIS